MRILAAALAAGSLLASPRSSGPGISTFTLVITGFFSTSASGTGPLSYARRRPAVGKSGERMEIKLRGESAYGTLDFDATPDVTGRPPFSEKGRYDIGALGAIGTITRNRSAAPSTRRAASSSSKRVTSATFGATSTSRDRARTGPSRARAASTPTSTWPVRARSG